MLSRKSSTNLDLEMMLNIQNPLPTMIYDIDASVPVMVIPGVESDHDLPIPPLTEGDAVAVVAVLKQGHQHASQGVAVAESVGDTVLPPGVYLGDHQDVVE